MAREIICQRSFSHGAQHIVDITPEGELVKYPHVLGKTWDKSSFESVQRDISTLKEHQVRIPNTTILAHPVIKKGAEEITPEYAIIAQHIRGKVFRELDLKAEKIREQLRSMTQKSFDIRKKMGAALDFLGGEAAYHFLRYMLRERKAGQLGAYNLLLPESGEITLIDTNLLDPSRAPFYFHWIVEGMVDLQHQLLALMLQDEELISRAQAEKKTCWANPLASKAFSFSRSLEKRRAKRRIII